MKKELYVQIVFVIFSFVVIKKKISTNNARKNIKFVIII